MSKHLTKPSLLIGTFICLTFYQEGLAVLSTKFHVIKKVYKVLNVLVEKRRVCLVT